MTANVSPRRPGATSRRLGGGLAGVWPPEATRWVKTALYADGTVGSL